MRAWQVKIRGEVAEYGRRIEYHLAKLSAVVCGALGHQHTVCLGSIGSIESTQHVSHEQYRFTQVSVVRIGLSVTASFRIKKDRRDDRFHIAANTRSVVGKYSRTTPDISRARIAGHQLMNHVGADEGAGIRMIEQVVDGGVKRRDRIRLRSGGLLRGRSG